MRWMHNRRPEQGGVPSVPSTLERSAQVVLTLLALKAIDCVCVGYTLEL